MPSADFKGCAEVRVVPDPATFLKDSNSAGIPLVGYVSGSYCVEIGQCCDPGTPYPSVCLGDTLTASECAAIGRYGVLKPASAGPYRNSSPWGSESI